MSRPDILQYLDYRQYLREYFEYLHKKDRKYSQRWVAMKAGWKSPHLLSMILKGHRKLSVEKAQLLSMALGLTEKEEEYLLILVDLENADHQEKQFEILDRIRFQFQNGLFQDLPDAGVEYIKKWYFPVVRELAALKRFSFKSQLISEVLDISEEEAQEAIDLLLKLGFLVKTESGYERHEPSIKAADYISPMIMLQYHLQILERSFKAVQLNREIRHFDSLVVALSSRDIEAVRDKIRAFIREIDMLGENSSRRDDVFQLSIQFFSLTGGKAREVSQ